MSGRQFIYGAIAALGLFDASGDPAALILTGVIVAIVAMRVFHVKR